ncbi:ROCK1 [Symbiodinium pilosum]|uniref:ROCK1 protein n=1 Tax=Symbiodinium pilosum TaxID=2952 RepID=A0A812KQ73_SYMPI|nr:ROCK1 [Symbiodinium pilosum]
MKPERAQKTIQDYVSGKGVAERVSQAFSSKFGYETRDANVLYRFWQSMTISVRSGQKVRGFADHEALQALEQTFGCCNMVGQSQRDRVRVLLGWCPGHAPEAKTNPDVLAEPLAPEFLAVFEIPHLLLGLEFQAAGLLANAFRVLWSALGVVGLLLEWLCPAKVAKGREEADILKQLSQYFAQGMASGIQPLLAKQFIHRDCVTSSLVFCAEMAKVVGCIAIMSIDDTGKRCFSNWKLQDCLLAAGIPSITYVVQNFCVQVAYQNLDAVVFNVLNQSKVLFTALFSFLISGRKQSPLQCAALVLVTFGGILVSIPDTPPAQAENPKEDTQESRFLGLACALVGSALSGLGSGIAEWALQRRGRNSFLLSLELASMGCMIISTTSLLGLSPDSVRMRQNGLFAGWTFRTWIPVLSQGLSGIIVGIITQVAGGVRKVMATICGLILTCLPGAYKAVLEALDLWVVGKRRDLSILARSKPRLDALEFIRALAKRFPEDKTLKHMLKQCLEGASSSAAADPDAYNLLVDTTVLKEASRDKAPKPAAGRLDARLKLQLPSQAEGSFHKWLEQDTERAGRFLHLLQDASKVSKSIRRYMRHRAKQCLERGAKLGPTGPVVPARNRTEADLPALYVIEDTFAHLCRRFGANEVYVRFGPYYLCRTVQETKEVKPLIEEVTDSTQGGAVIDCPTHGISCGPSKAPELDQQFGWRPDIASHEFSLGGSWWQMDLGRLHSCAGVRLEWNVPTMKKVTYASRAQLQSDLALANGDGYQIVVTDVREGGTAFLARVKRGDVLQLNAGGNADDAFVGLSPAEALTKLANEFSQPLTLVFKGPQMSGESQRLQRLLEQPLKVKVLASKKDVAPAADSPEQWETIQEQEVAVSTQHPCIVPTIFVARWVRLQFESPWPKLDNEALAVSVKAMKVWRLAPPLFRQQFLEVLRQVERQAVKGHALVQQPSHERRFWASSVKPQSFNMVVNMDIVRRIRQSHDSEGDEMLALQMMCMRDKKEFNILRSDEMVALRQRIFSKEEDILECTFHPRTAANVPGHVYKFRERISDRMDASKVTGIKDFVKDLGEEFKAHKYPNYWKVHRRAMLQKAKRDFVRGALKSAMEKLQRHFGVQQMLDRFRCYHKNCGRKLDHHTEICKCAGFYCHIHQPPQVHNCKDMKKILEAKAKEAKDLEIKLREEGGDPPPEEKFDNKVEIGLLLEAHELAESIQAAMKEKDRQKHSLERLGQSLASFGAVRLMERPFKRRMCPEAVEKRRARSAEALNVLPRWMGGSKFNAEGGPRTPRLGSRSDSKDRCKCPNAHSPSELRFPAGESVVRRMDWVKKAVRRADLKSETVPNSAAERELLEKRRKEEEKVPGPPPLQAGETPRPRPEPLKGLVMRVLEEKAFSLKHAFGLCCEARALLEEGENPKAELRVNEARELAQKSQDEAQASDAELAGRGQARMKRVWRPLRDCEKEEVQMKRAAVQEEAQQILNVCSILDEEVRLRQKFEPQTLPPPPPPGTDPLPPPPPRVQGLRAFEDDVALAQLLAQAADEPQEGKMLVVEQKREMCAQFLEVGSCILDQRCPFAHCPSELFGHGVSRSPERKQADYAQRLVEEYSHMAKQEEQASCASAYDHSVAAADDATLRRLLLANDSPPLAKRW